MWCEKNSISENYVVTFRTFTSYKIGLKSNKIWKVISGQRDKDYTMPLEIVKHLAIIMWERISTPNVPALAYHSRRKQSNEPIRIRIKDIKRGKTQASFSWLVLVLLRVRVVMIGCGFASHWLNKWGEFANQLHSGVNSIENRSMDS